MSLRSPAEKRLLERTQRVFNAARDRLIHNRKTAERIADELSPQEQANMREIFPLLPEGFGVHHIDTAVDMKLSHLGDRGGADAHVLVNAEVATDRVEESMRKVGRLLGRHSIPYTMSEKAERGTFFITEIIVNVKGPLNHISHLIVKFVGYDPIAISAPESANKLVRKDDCLLQPDDNGMVETLTSREAWRDDQDNQWTSWCRLLIFRPELLRPTRDIPYQFDLVITTQVGGSQSKYAFNVQTYEREVVGTPPRVKSQMPGGFIGHRPMDVAVGFAGGHHHADLDNASLKMGFDVMRHRHGDIALTAPNSGFAHRQGNKLECKQLTASAMLPHNFSFHARQPFNPDHVVSYDGPKGPGTASQIRRGPGEGGGGGGGGGEDGGDDGGNDGGSDGGGGYSQYDNGNTASGSSVDDFNAGRGVGHGFSGSHEDYDFDEIDPGQVANNETGARSRTTVLADDLSSNCVSSHLQRRRSIEEAMGLTTRENFERDTQRAITLSMEDGPGKRIKREDDDDHRMFTSPGPYIPSTPSDSAGHNPSLANSSPFRTQSSTPVAGPSTARAQSPTFRRPSQPYSSCPSNKKRKFSGNLPQDFLRSVHSPSPVRSIERSAPRPPPRASSALQAHRSASRFATPQPRSGSLGAQSLPPTLQLRQRRERSSSSSGRNSFSGRGHRLGSMGRG